MRVIISSEQRRIWVGCQNISTSSLRADTKQQLVGVWPGLWEGRMKEAMGQSAHLRTVDLRTTAARQLLNHEGRRNIEEEITGGIIPLIPRPSEHKTIWIRQEHVPLRSGLLCWDNSAGLGRLRLCPWPHLIHILGTFREWVQQAALVIAWCLRVSTAVLWAI